MLKKYKILVVVTEFPSVSETFILNQITDLIDKGHSITIFSYNHNKNSFAHQLYYDYNLADLTITHFKNEKTNWHFLKGIITFFFKYRTQITYSKLFKLLNPLKWKENRAKAKVFYDLPVFLLNTHFDLVHCHFGFNGRKVAEAMRIGVCSARKAIVSFHGSDLTPSKINIYQNVYKDLFFFFDAFIVNSIYLQEILFQVKGDLDKCYLLPEGFKTSYLNQFLSTVKISPKFNIVFCGRLIQWKGPDLAIKIVKKLVDRGTADILFHLIGNGEMMGELRRLVKELHLEENVILYGALSQEQVFKIMAGSDVFLLPGIQEPHSKRSEAQGLVIQEAQFFKLPLLVGNVGGVKYGMLNGTTGFLIEENNMEVFVEKILFLYQNPEKRIKMGEKGHDWVKNEFEISLLGNKLIKVYDLLN
ncbi:glycosyltransferase [Flavobacterium lacus]|uniref:Colanic acid/amylovoran biosynthesis glycosyltransferase n=1 Tax=Flavobacterium lacus TaxID=1353778 RepID=A0A328WK65_9FLAO|nr:glycosyltransferase [Flavobacterium lacus]RAR46603.1 colanic acid/amylovoran biosynthesis glycosyltransferase [Flavobacterium lacus]